MGKPQTQDHQDEKDNFVDELKPGTKLMHGQYTIQNFLNAGGFGITYLAKDSLERKIVIKECFPGAFCRRSRYVVQARSRAHQNELKSIVRLFVQEARSLAKLDHPNIVGVHQVFEDNDTAYMALDFVDGRDLLDIIEDPEHTLTPSQIKVILKEVLGAVGFIHDQNILHRDISPDNILINESYHPVLIDFGAAREEATKQSRVLSALRVVKDGYSPQEFYIAGSEQSPSSDLYALAASFHHLIADDVPPNSQARLAAIASGEADPYIPLAGRFDAYEPDFLAAIDKALAVLPKDRLQSAQDWINMMDGLHGNVTALNVAGSDPQRSGDAVAGAAATKSKTPILLGSAAVIALLAGVGFYVATSGGEEAAQPTTTATATETVTETPAPAPVETTPVVEPTPVEEPATEIAALPDPVVEDPAVEAPVVEAPVVEAPVIEEPVIEAPVIEEPVVEDPIVAEPEPEVVPTPVPTGPVIIDVPTTTPDLENAPVIATEPTTAEPVTQQEQIVIAGPAVTEQPVPDIRPEARPEVPPVAATPVIEEPPLPEPVDTPRPNVVEPDANAQLPSQPTNRPVANAATPDVALPATPDTIALVGSGLVVSELPALIPGNEIVEPESAVEVTWAVQLPFEPASPGSNLIGEVAFISPTWVSPGLEIASVNGIEVDSIDEIPRIVQATSTDTEADRIDIIFSTIDGTGSEQDYPWSVPVIQTAALDNGLSFEMAYNGTEWLTTVASVPDSLVDTFQVGDIILSNLTTGETIEGRNTIIEILERELSDGAGEFAFDVQRNDARWLAPFSYTVTEN